MGIKMKQVGPWYSQIQDLQILESMGLEAMETTWTLQTQPKLCCESGSEGFLKAVSGEKH